jgi:serine/threonine protein kinase
MVHNEVQVLRSVRHNSIVRLFEIIQDRDKLVLIMEYVPGGDLYSMVKKRKRVGERICAHILKGVADALFELHRLKTDAF